MGLRIPALEAIIQTEPTLIRDPLSHLEWPMAVISLALCGIGLTLIYSAAAPLGEGGRAFLTRQITWCSLGVVLMSALLFVDYSVIERWAIWFYLAVILLLAAAWTVGRVTAGSRRWLDFGLMRLQPSEFAKVAVVLVLAKYFRTRAGMTDLGLTDLVSPLLLALVPAAFVVIQPDLGTAAVIMLIAASMVLFAGIGRRVLLWTAGVMAAAAPVLYFVGDQLLLDYQKRRLLTFLNPQYDPLGAGYHIIQSQIAIGSGGALGKGFLQGTQNQLMFLPVKHTDFIFSVLAEEWGFLGCLAVLLLFGALVLRGLTIAAKARDNFGALVAFGCTVMIFWHLVINVGMVTGLLPVVGVPLSFLSYGGSSLLASFMAVSLTANVSMRRFTH
jgi:rod shape determining protein RodA